MSSASSVVNPSPWPRRMALAVACATFPLVFVGGLVTSYDAGMAVPDWPTTFGYNLFLYPVETWFFGPWDLFIEHGHRLLGALVGLLTIGLVAAVWLADGRRSLRWLTVAALIAVIVQGVLGGLRVQLNEVQLAKIHGCFGPAFFAFVCCIAAMTSRRWNTAETTSIAGASRLRRLAVSTAALAYVQVVLGAHLRHVPANMSGDAFRAVLIFHLIVAASLAFHAAFLAWRIRGASRAADVPCRAANMLALLIAFQIALGGGTWVVKYGWPAWFAETRLSGVYVIAEQSFLQAGIVTAHVAVGSLILAASALAALWTFRYVRPLAAAPVVLSGLFAPNFAALPEAVA